MAHLSPQHRTYALDCHVPILAPPSPSLRLVAVAVASAATSSFGAAGSIRSFGAATPISSLSLLQGCKAELAVVAGDSRCRGGRGPASSSADGRATLQLGACRRRRPCSVERR